MKQITLLICSVLLIGFTAKGQENKTIKEVTTVTRVVKKEGSKVIVKETKATNRVKGSVVVAGGDSINQRFKEDSVRVKEKKVLVDETNIDKTNEALILAEKKRQEQELIKSKAEAKAKAEKEKAILDAKKKELEDQLKANRKKLEKRGKGMAKLDKRKKKKGKNN